MHIRIQWDSVRLAGFYFAYFAAMGVFTPYWGIYMDSLHYSPLQIGAIMALPQLANIVAPGLSGAIADKRGHRAHMIRWLSISCAMLFAASLLSHQFIWQFISLFTVFLAYTAIMPLLEATTLQHLHGAVHQYGKIRLWGTLGFLLIAAGGSYLTELFGIHILPRIPLLLFSCMAIWSFSLTDHPPTAHKPTRAGFFVASMKKNIIILFVSCFFIVMAHGVYNAFYSIHLLRHDYGKTMIGGMWMIATISEAVSFMLSSSLMMRFGVKKVYIFSFLAAVLRFILIGWFAHIFWLLGILQVLHGSTYALHHAASMIYLEKHYPSHLLSRAQALYLSGPYGVGAALGGMIAGATWTAIGAGWVFTLAGCFALLGFVIACNLPHVKK